MLSHCENDVKSKQDELAAPRNNIEQGERGIKIFLPAKRLARFSVSKLSEKRARQSFLRISIRSISPTFLYILESCANGLA